MTAATVENSRPVVALIRLLGWATSWKSRRDARTGGPASVLTSAPSRRQDRALRALSAPQDRSYATQTPSQPLCSVLGCTESPVAAPHGWNVCSTHLPSGKGVMIAAR